MTEEAAGDARPPADVRVIHRPYFFELFTLANFLVIHALLVRYVGLSEAVYSLPRMLRELLPAIGGQLVVGVVIRAIVMAVRGELRGYLRVLRTRRWLIDSVRLVIGAVLVIHTYSWIKLMVPLLHPRLFDQQLWDLDRVVFFGMSPTVFFLSLFSTGPALRILDFTYAYVFFASINIAFIYFLSSPSRRLRVAFVDGNTLMWIVGAWLYMLVPSIGPAYRFPEVWLEYAPQLANTHRLQSILIHNYQMVLHRLSPVQILFGVAAFPSLHVAFLTFVFFWMRRLWRYGGIVFGVFAFAMVLGSVVTGWHYLIDSLAGLVLAYACYAASARLHRFRRWLHLREIPTP